MSDEDDAYDAALATRAAITGRTVEEERENLNAVAAAFLKEAQRRAVDEGRDPTEVRILLIA